VVHQATFTGTINSVRGAADMNTVSSPSLSRQAPADKLGDPAQKNPAGDSRLLNDWTFKVLVDHGLSRKAIAAALFLRDTFDLQAGFSSPSFRSIAAATGLSRGSAERAVRMLVAMGHVRVIAGGGGPDNSNLYQLTGGLRR
jgi:hypothetical protein